MFPPGKEDGNVVRAYPNAPLRIEGHTDAKGSDSYNQALSERQGRQKNRRVEITLRTG